MSDPKPADLFARNREWHERLSEVGDSVLFAVGAAYARRSDYGLTQEAWPKIPAIAKATGLGVRTVERKVMALATIGFMKKGERRGGGPFAYGFVFPTEDVHTLRLRLAEINGREWPERSAAQDVSDRSAAQGRSAPCGGSDPPSLADQIRPEDRALRSDPSPDPVPDPILATVASAPAAPPREQTPKQAPLFPTAPTSTHVRKSTSRGAAADGAASPPASDHGGGDPSFLAHRRTQRRQRTQPCPSSSRAA